MVYHTCGLLFGLYSLCHNMSWYNPREPPLHIVLMSYGLPLFLEKCFIQGVYKQWNGPLEWWNTGIVDWS